MKGFAFLALCVGFVVAGPSSQAISARHHAIVEARGPCDNTGGWDNNCHVPGTPDQGIANRVYKVCKQRGLNGPQTLAVFETALVESNMHNLPCGHADSVGVMQQRSCAGWGSYNQLMNVEYAIGKFIDVLLDRCRSGSPGSMAQCVQRSEFPGAYDQKAGVARALLAKTQQIVGGGGGDDDGGDDGGSANVGGKPPANNTGGSGACTYQKPKAGDSATGFAGRYHITFTQLKNWNPSINASGSNLSAGKSYCVSKSGKPASNNNGGGGSTGGCKTATTKSGATCSTFAKANGITFARLRQLNSNINANCTNLRANTKYCVA